MAIAEISMSDLQKALSVIKNDTISSDQTMFVDVVLSRASATDIPYEESPAVLKYIDLELAHNPISPELRIQLLRLYAELQELQGRA